MVVEFITHSCYVPEYKIEVRTCQKNKRTWAKTYDSDSYKYRRMDIDERIKFVKDSILSVISIEEYDQALLDLWIEMKPDLKQK